MDKMRALRGIVPPNSLAYPQPLLSSSAPADDVDDRMRVGAQKQVLFAAEPPALIVLCLMSCAGCRRAFESHADFMRRAKTTEAIDEIDRLYKASSAYYTAAPMKDVHGDLVPCQFPKSVALTPALSCCDLSVDKDGDSSCDGDPTLWSNETWVALGFSMKEPHYFRYAYTSSGTGAEAKFTASAYADLDCDGVFSTFQRVGFGDASATRSECSVRGSSSFVKVDELE